MVVRHLENMFRHAPWGLLGMLVLALVVESALERVGFGSLDLTSLSWRSSGRAAGREAIDCRVLCFGDSLVKFGIAPRVLEDQTGQRAYNLAVNAGSAPVSFFLLRRALRAGARPDALIVDIEPGIFAKPPTTAPPALWGELVTAVDALDLGLAARDAGFLAKTFLCLNLASFRYRSYLSARIMADLRGQPQNSREPSELLALERNVSRNRGAQIMPSRVGNRNVVDTHNSIIFPEHWSGNGLNVRYFERFLSLASAHGIRVLWLLPPYSPAVQVMRERLGQDATFTRFVAEVQLRYPQVVVVDGRRSGYDPAVFFDSLIHLDSRGANVLSHQVSAILTQALQNGPTPRWAQLPAYRRPSDGIVLEDVEQSRIALGSSQRTME